MRYDRNAAVTPITKINVTPIIDVALVLVIILLVTAPLLSIADLPVSLPGARARGAETERNVSVTMDVQGRLAVDDQPTDADGLRETLARRLAATGGDALVVIRADASLSYEHVRALLSDARAAGARRLAIATRQRREEAD